MDQRLTAQKIDQKRTEGIEDPMFGKGLGYRIGQAIVDWAERLNLKYSIHGNPPVYDNAAFPWVAGIEREWKLIRAELDRVLTRKDELPGFHEILSEVSTISTDRDWKTFVLCGYGSVSEEGVRACPETWRILQKIPRLKAAMFSILEPGKHLKPHRGPYNGVLRLHLGLKVPEPREKIAIRVLDRICHWDEGKVLLFDDAYEHEAWNRSGETRVVLFVDFVKPTRFPASAVNWLLINLAPFTPFIREGYQAQRKWEKLFFAGSREH